MNKKRKRIIQIVVGLLVAIWIIFFPNPIDWFVKWIYNIMH